MGLPRYQMTEEEIEAVLRTEGYGVLSMADDGVGYGVPLSFGYRDGRLFFVLQRQGQESRKQQFADASEVVSFLVSDVRSRDDWCSVILTGWLRPVDDEWDVLSAALDDNAWFPSLFSEAEPMQNWLGYELVVEEQSGLKGSTFTCTEP